MLSARTIDKYVELVNEKVAARTALTAQQIFEAVERDCQNELSKLVEDLQEIVPHLEIPPPHLYALNANLFVAILGYGKKRRKLGDHTFFNHPYEAAKIAAEAYGDLRLTDLDTFLVRIGIGLHHDRAEERVEDRLKKEKQEIRTETVSEIFPRKRRLPNRRIFFAFSQVAEYYGVHLPEYEEEMPEYRKRLEELVGRKNVKQTLRRRNASSQNIWDYFPLAEKYRAIVEEKTNDREIQYLEEERRIFAHELATSLIIAENFWGEFDASQVHRRIRVSVNCLTRTSAEHYYKSSKRVVASRNWDTIIGKLVDRRANMRNLDLREPATDEIRYFKYTTKREERQTSRELKASLIRKEDRLDLVSLLTLSDDEEKGTIDQRAYEIVRENAERQRRENIYDRKRGSRKVVRTHLRPHDKLYQLYKNIISITHIRSKYQPAAIPVEAKYHLYKLLAETREEAAKIVEETFSSYCRQESPNFKLADARRIYLDMQEYEKLGGFARVTQEAQGAKDPSIFDGLLKRYFDQRVRGNKSLNGTLLYNKGMLFATALALHRLTEIYIQDQEFYLDGMTYQGLKPSLPVAGRNRE